MKQFHTKGRENSGKLCVLPPLLGERAGVRASVSSNPIFGVGGASSPRRLRTPERAIAVVNDFEFGPVQNLFDQFKPAFERRKKRVALDDSLDEREVKIGAERQCLRVNLRPAADEDVPPGDYRLRTAPHPVPLPIRWGEISPNKFAR